MISASAIPRLLACPTSAVLRQHRYESDSAAAGTEYHEELEAAIDTGDESNIPDEVLALIREGDETLTERKFVYNTATDQARELRAAGKRAYDGIIPGIEIPGTPDLIVRGNGRVLVVDFKSYEDVGSAERNAQIATYALMVARAWGIGEVEVAIVYRAAWRKPSMATLGPLDLDAHAGRLKQLQIDVAKAKETPQLFLNEGSHCRYCPAFLGGCPRQDALRKQVATGELALMNEARIPFDDDNEAADAFEILQRLKTMTARLTAALYARAKERPIPLPDGKVLAFVEKEGKRKIDGDKAYAMLKEKFGTVVADAAVRRSVAQKWIGDAFKQHGIKTSVKSIVDALEKSGAVSRDTKTSPEVVPAVRLLKEAG